ncbi:hypothetical protein GCM10027052_00130 [Parafrigoribacterium mesophilum]|uniref:hypothetical protein n=1 Tax=Parafrigoribacterium mesophilum TaxID=433646 RepID=UPI0031FBD614
MSDENPSRANTADPDNEGTPAAVPVGSTPGKERSAEVPFEEPVRDESQPDDSRRNEPAATERSEPIPDLVEPPAAPHTSPFAPDSTHTAVDAEPEHQTEDLPAAEPEAVEPAAAAVPVTAMPDAGTPTPAVKTVYLTAPTPPRARGNRGIGTLMAVLATAAFAILLALVAALYRGLAGTEGLAAAFSSWLPGFVALPLFYVPVAVFLVLFVVFVLLVNRAGWWVYVLGSFLLAAALYFASIGILLALDGMMFNFTGHTSFASLAVNPAIVIATIVSREVAIWFGAAISSRGRRVKARNIEAAAAYERDTAEKKAEFERSQYGTVS